MTPDTLKYIAIGAVLGIVFTAAAGFGYAKYAGVDLTLLLKTSGTAEQSRGDGKVDWSKIPVALGGTLMPETDKTLNMIVAGLKVVSATKETVVAEATIPNQPKRSYTVHLTQDTKVEKESCVFNPKGGPGALFTCTSAAAASSDIAAGKVITVRSTVKLNGDESDITAQSILIHAATK